MGKILFKQSKDKCYLDSAPLKTMVKRWYADLKYAHTDTNDAECTGHPNSVVTLENTKELHKFVLANCKLKLREIAEELKISESSVFTILHEHLSMRKLCSKWVTQTSAGKVLASIFWDVQGILSIDYLEKGRTINSKYHIALLVYLKEEITKKQPQVKKKKVLFTKTMHHINCNDGKTT